MSVQPQLIIAPSTQGQAQKMADLQRQLNEVKQSFSILKSSSLNANNITFWANSIDGINFKDSGGTVRGQLGAGAVGSSGSVVTITTLTAKATLGYGQLVTAASDTTNAGNHVSVMVTNAFGGGSCTATIMDGGGNTDFVQRGTMGGLGLSGAPTLHGTFIVAPASTSVFIASGGTTTVTFTVPWNPSTTTTMVHSMFTNGSLMEQLGWAISSVGSNTITISLHNSASSACAGTASFDFIVYA